MLRPLPPVIVSLPRPPIEDVALGVALERIVAAAAPDVADVGDPAADTGGSVGRQVDRDAGRVARVIQPVVGALHRRSCRRRSCRGESELSSERCPR